MENQIPQGLDPTAFILTKAIKRAESGGDYNAIGDSGTSTGAYQIQQSNWKPWAKQYLGDENAPMTEENQNKLMYTRIKGQLDSGLTQSQIASIHNSGNPDPNAVGKGHNSRLNVDYDVPAYVSNVQKHYQTIQQEIEKGFNPTPYSTPSEGNQFRINYTTAGGEQTPTDNKPESLGGKALDVAKGVGDFLFPIVGDVYHDLKGDSKKTKLQQVGDLGLSALPFIPGLGEAGLAAKGAEGAGLLAKIGGGAVAKGAITGYGAGFAANLSQGKGVGESLKPDLNTVGGAVLGGATPKAVGLLGSVAKKISGVTPQIENALREGGITLEDYNRYIQAAKNHTGNIRTPSALNLAADELDTAANKITTIREQAGKAVGEAKKMAADVPMDRSDIVDTAKKFAQHVQEKFGLDLTSNEAGRVSAVPVEGSLRQVAPSEVKRVEDMASQLNKLYAQKEPNVKQVTEVMSNFDELVDHTKDDIYGHTNDPLSSLIKDTAGNLNNGIRKGSKELATANDRFSAIKTLEEEISKMAGKNLQKGELLMRRVFSGDKSGEVQGLFEKIKGLTGIDLVNHAVLARHAIETVGGQSEKTLLEQILQGGIGAKNEGVLSTLIGLGKSGLRKYGANPETIGRKAVTGKTGGLLQNLVTKGAVEAGSRGSGLLRVTGAGQK